MALTVNEIYPCILGESTRAGLPCTLIRLTGCHLRCTWCDSEHAFYEGTRHEVEDVATQVAELGLRQVLLTGGEPWLQPDARRLVERLADDGFDVQLETSGAVELEGLDTRAHLVMDVKCPGSGESGRMIWNNLERLRRTDDVKFVVADRRDYEWARAIVREHGLEDRANVLLSAVHGRLEPRELAEWILADRLRARLHLQVHKVVWEPDARRV